MKNALLSFDVFDLSAQSDSISGMEGHNAREILILYGPAEDKNVLVFLERVLRAAQVDLSKDTQHLALATEAVPPYTLLNRALGFKILIAFGFSPADLGLQFNWAYYVPIQFQGKIFMFCDPLSLLMEERASGGSARSGPFWQALQQIFLNK